MSKLKVIPLGGLGEIGMNCMVLEQAGRRVMIDCGVTFDDGDNGIDTVHPAFSALVGEPDALDGVIVTHGHEDHIGALGDLLGTLERAGRRSPLPIWGNDYALALCRRRLDEATAELGAELIPTVAGTPFTAGPFTVEAMRMTHSIPFATSLHLRTEAGNVVHTGDFKLDAEPRDGVVTDLERLAELAEEGVALLMSDSTNVLTSGTSTSERIVADELERLIGDAAQRVVVGLFASNIHRVDAVAAAARHAGRKLCLLGRSVRDHTRIARELGVLRWKSDLVVSPDVARQLPRDQIVYIASGTQAEPRGALARLAYRTHNELKLNDGDVVLMSSRIIPGNERAVFAMQDAFLAAGVDVMSRITHPRIHTSGHGHREELKRMLETVRPRSFIPLHGTRLHLRTHADLAREVGVDEVMILHDGETAELHPDGLRNGNPVAAGSVATAFGHVLDDEVIRQRRQVGRGGVVTVAVVGEHAVVSAQGVPRTDDVERVARELAAARCGDGAETIRRCVRSRLHDMLGYKPLVIVRATK